MIAGQHYDAALQRIRDEDVIGRFIRRESPAEELCAANGAVALQWFDATGRLLDAAGALDTVEREAAQLIDSGCRHVIWAGMGGSAVPMQTLLAIAPARRHIEIHPLDSTDPAALDALTVAVTGRRDPGPETLRSALRQVVMVAVAMGVSSEEPIGHLEWFAGLLQQVRLRQGDHIRVLAIPDSALERYAHEHGLRVDNIGVADDEVPPGRMSAPAARPFLLPLALSTTLPLRPMLQQAWEWHALERARHDPDRNRFVRLAATLSAATGERGMRLLLRLPPGWDALHTYVEQLLEQSLGKLGKGVVVFRRGDHDEGLGGDGLCRVTVATTPSATDCDFALYAPELAVADYASRVTALLTHIMGWQLVTAIYGYLHRLPITTEPAVEPYKVYARALRRDYLHAPPWPDVAQDLPILIDEHGVQAGDNFAPQLALLLLRRRDDESLRLSYLDVTINAELAPADEAVIHTACRRLAVKSLGVPFKLRRAPAEYHVSEQAQMDGPAGIVSLRFVPRQVPPARCGRYDGRFLTAGAVATQSAMVEAGRTCVLIVVPRTDDSFAGFVAHLLHDITAVIDADSVSGADRRPA
jgi:hypothetical protein